MGRSFHKRTDQLVYNFNASISFDQKFYKQDIQGSIAHVTMLASTGVLTEEERDQIIEGLMAFWMIWNMEELRLPVNMKISTVLSKQI